MSSPHVVRTEAIGRDPAIRSAPRGCHELVERVVIQGDLAVLTVEERTAYYLRVCESLGLNCLTQPFKFITLNGELRLYALKDCTEQLRALHGVSVEELSEGERAGVIVITAKVRNRAGRTDIAKGAVSIANLKGEDLANALMKAETKAKRRATLSICGLGLLDESEVEDIPAAQRGPEVDVPALPLPEPGRGSVGNGKVAAAPAELPMPPSMAEVVGATSIVPSAATPTDSETEFDPKRFLAQLKDRFEEAVLSGDPWCVEEVWEGDQDLVAERLSRSDREIAHDYYAEAQERVLET